MTARNGALVTVRLFARALAAGAGAIALAAACSSEGGPQSSTTSGGSSNQSSGGQSSGGASSSGGANPAGGSSAGTVASGGTAGSQAPTDGGTNVELELRAIGANGTIGLEWNAVDGAESYRIYYSTGPSVGLSDPSVTVAAPRISYVHRGLPNGTEHRYLVTAVVGSSESAPSNEATATPEGEWVLEELGSGSIGDVSTGMPAPRIPIERRLHVLLFAEGYTAEALPGFHDHATHDGERNNDVDRWVDLVFGIQPYTEFREAFVVWYLPRASNTDIDGGDTAFQVPIVSGPGVGAFNQSAELGSRAWAAIGQHPFPPTDFSGGGFGSVRNAVAAFLIFDPARGRAGVSGRAGALANPDDNQQRISSAFGIGHAHEFTHAFSGLRDEYLENDNSAPNNWSGTSNVVGTNQCGELPWAHLLAGSAINPDTEELVGAFGVPAIGFHSELLCLLNGTHDNAEYYGGDGLLRVEDRMCNFCREITAFRVYQRSGLLENGDAGFETWTSEYRSAFYDEFGFAVPATVPQTNNVRMPANGTPIYEACSDALEPAPPAPKRVASDTRSSGCIIE